MTAFRARLRFHPQDDKRITRIPQSRSDLRFLGARQHGPSRFAEFVPTNPAPDRFEPSQSSSHKQGLELISDPPGIATRRQDGNPGNPLFRMAEATN